MKKILSILFIIIILINSGQQVYATSKFDEIFFNLNNIIYYDATEICNSNSSPSELSGVDNAEKIWNFLKSKGFTDAAIAGILGNSEIESGVNPKKYEADYIEKIANLHDKMKNNPTVLIPRKGTITNIFYTEKPFWNVDTIYYTEIDNSLILPKFFFYFMDNFDLKKLDTGKSGRPSLTQSVLNEIKIPLPPLERQKEIVEILDKFEKLTNDISQGLPAEITARRKQYEYYRNKLLTFNELP
jgi:type I restriction enzyme S subunit